MTVIGACLLVFAASAAAAFQSGTYKGKSSQGLSVQIKVTQTKMLSAHYKADYVCKHPDGTTGSPPAQPTTLGPTSIKPGQKIDSHQRTPNGADKVRFVVKLAGKSATGTLNEQYRTRQGSVCRSGTAGFTLKR